MSSEFIAEAGKLLLAALVGGLATSATALPIFNNKLTKVTTELQTLKESCVSCKAAMGNAVEGLSKKVTEHHEDDEKHNNKSSEKLLNDILNRVMRIENRMFNGHADATK